MDKCEKSNCWYYTDNVADYYRVILEPAVEGTYIFLYRTKQSEYPEQDYLQEDIDDAKRFCEQELHLRKDGWREDPSIVKLMD